MEEIAISLIHLHQDLDSIQFQSLSLLDDIPFFDFDDIANGEKRKLLIMLERFANTNLCLMHSFQENKKFFNGPVFNHIKDKTRCNCYCISCETIGFEDIPSTVKRMLCEIPNIIRKLQNFRQKYEKLSKEDEVFLIRLQTTLNRMNTDLEIFFKNEYLS